MLRDGRVRGRAKRQGSWRFVLFFEFFAHRIPHHSSRRVKVPARRRLPWIVTEEEGGRVGGGWWGDADTRECAGNGRGGVRSQTAG